ncbi:MAG: phosphotransferase [Bacteroidaceae bacterium]|nr:phosphotransferase [Bacteroidaceae bacterium]
MEKLKDLYARMCGCAPQSVVRLTGDGSNRVYYRMTGVSSVIGVVGTSVEENRAFVALSKAFRSAGVAAPAVLAVSDDDLCYLQDDLGDSSLYGVMTGARESGVFESAQTELLCRVVAELPKIQFGVAKYFDFSLCYPVSDFNERTVMWDLNYFKYCFLKGVGVEFNENRLEDEFVKLTTMLLSDNDNIFLYRDFQSRNVMLKDGEPYFIDFQGGRRGPVYYDIASFVGQARAKYTAAAVDVMLEAYLDALAGYKTVDRVYFMKMLSLFRVFRLLQNLGAYGYRGLFERKKAFVESIPAALAQLQEQLDVVDGMFPYISSLVREIAMLPMFVRSESKELTVDVMSFSYKRGIPDDISGNGGGFVFDCRAIHNPGRYEPYKKLTGMDEPVIKFLETESNIVGFLEHAYALVDEMVDTYKSRGFTHIQVCCGCTGGQHRSVYSAEHIARHIADKFGVRVVVTHKMQGVHYVIDAK